MTAKKHKVTKKTNRTTKNPCKMCYTGKQRDTILHQIDTNQLQRTMKANKDRK